MNECGFYDGIDDMDCGCDAEFIVRRLAGGSLERRACGRHVVDVLMTTDGLEPPWVVWPVGDV